MNVYEEAHNLAKAIEESEEYRQFEALKKQIEKEPELDDMVKNFQKKQFEIQAKQMMGENPGPEIIRHIQELYGIIVQNPLVARYMEAEIRLNLMMSDVYKILGDLIGIGKFR